MGDHRRLVAGGTLEGIQLTFRGRDVGDQDNAESRVVEDEGFQRCDGRVNC